MQTSFTYVTGGAGGAAGNVGVPVLQGLGGGSATGDPFPSLVWFGARVTESSRGEPPELCFCLWPIFLALGPIFRSGRKPTAVAFNIAPCVHRQGNIKGYWPIEGPWISLWPPLFPLWPKRSPLGSPGPQAALGPQGGGANKACGRLLILYV